MVGAQPVEHFVSEHIKGNGKDLKKGYAIGVLQSRNQGSDDLEIITMRNKAVKENFWKCSPETAKFLIDHKSLLESERFNTGHWVMADNPVVCYDEVAKHLHRWQDLPQ